MHLDEHSYKEVYVVCVDSITSTFGGLMICDSLEELLNHLATKAVGTSSNLRVLHGVLTSGKAIPKDMKFRQPFIILEDPESSSNGAVFDSCAEDDCEELAKEIENLLAGEEVASKFIDIDNVYILYGYEINPILSIDEEDINENVISDCLEVSIAARKLKESMED